MSSASSSASSGQISDPQQLAAPVITGLGIVTPLGVNSAEFFAGLRSGRCALRRDEGLGRLAPKKWAENDRRDPGAAVAPWAARIEEFGAATAIEASRRRRMPRLAQLGLVAAQQALGIGPGGPAGNLASALGYYGSERVAIVLGTGLGTLEVTMEFETGYIKSGLATASPALFPYTVMNTTAAVVAMELQLLGPNLTINHRDLSFHESVATAVDLLLGGRADAVLCGGCDELGPWLQHGVERVAGRPTESADGTPPMRPYDRERSGFVLGEGAVMLLLERADRAQQRGANPLATVSGIGRAGDDRPRLGWQRPGQPGATMGASRAIKHCLQAARLTPSELDFIVGSGNGSALDALETQALRQAPGSGCGAGAARLDPRSVR